MLSKPPHSVVRLIVSMPVVTLATIAAWTSINEVKLSDSSVLKRRRWYANLLRILGNFVIRFRKAPVRVLSTGDWIKREHVLAGATNQNGIVEMPRIEGIPLSQHLDSLDSEEEKFAAVSAAIRALHKFHQDCDQSHGDASATNVMIAEKVDGQLVATWFDFDVAHTGSSSIINRADDLRALLATSKLQFNSEVLSKSGSTVLRDAYPDEDVFDAALAMLESQIFDVFHLAQTRRVRRKSM